MKSTTLAFFALLAPLVPISSAQSVEIHASTTEVRANTYTYGSQEDPTLAIDAKGRILVTWSSRYQELGNYGVFAQLLDPLGRPLGTELHVNQTLPGCQQDSYPVFAPDGSAWVVWSSLDRRTENNGIFLRRLAETEDGFRPVDDEVFVAGGMHELYTDAAIAVNGKGELLVAWVCNGPFALTVEACRISPDGEVGEVFRPGEAAPGYERMPDIAALPDSRFAIVWQRADRHGVPRGLFGCLVGDEGVEGDELVPHDLAEAQHVEPSLDVDAQGRMLVAWMSRAEDSESWQVRARRFDATGAPLGESLVVDVGGEGHRNGATAISAPDGRFLVACNVHGDAYEREDGRTGRRIDVRARLFDAEGAPLGESWRVNEPAPGQRAMQIAKNGRHAVWSDTGLLVFTWAGTSKDDESGVAVRIFAPEGLDVPAPPKVTPVAAGIGLIPKDLERSARPDPLPEWRRRLPRTPGSSPQSAFGFVAHDQTGWIPPDPDLAVGPGHIVSQANQEIACHDKNGNQKWRKSNTGGSGFWAAQGAENFVYDPVCVYDWHSDRFIVANGEYASDGEYVCFAVSRDSTPDTASDWWKYRVKISPACTGSDFPTSAWAGTTSPSRSRASAWARPAPCSSTRAP